MSLDQDFDGDALTEDELRTLAEELEAASDSWEKVSYLSTLKMPCPECGGAGQVGGGSLGDTCPGCLGARAVEHPAAEKVDVPDLIGMRRRLKSYVDAWEDHRLPDDHRAKKNLALPPASSLPAVADMRGLVEQAKQIAKGEMPEQPQLPAPQMKRRDGLGAMTDEELDDLEDEIKEDGPIE